jgi:murein L,D-transpeptidase YafK
MKAKKLYIVLVLVCLVALPPFYYYGRSIWVPIYLKIVGKETVSSVIEKIGAKSDKKLTRYFSNAGVTYPPKKIKLLVMKEERIMELWAKDEGDFKLIKHHIVRGASGTSGPKLKRGDEQVPEGKYNIIGLNPNSSYHLSLKLNYPNDFDKLHAKIDGRTDLGSDIFIHGKSISIGCLAIGDKSIEELFTLVHRVGRENAEIVIAPYDPRDKPLIASKNGQPKWVLDLYEQISKEFGNFKEEI